jgi:hypothetical protein
MKDIIISVIMAALAGCVAGTIMTLAVAALTAM